MDREQVFQWIHKGDFTQIIDFLKTGQKTVAEDPILQQAIGHFFNDLLKKDNNNSDRVFTLQQLFNLHTARTPYYIFPDEQFEIIVVNLCELVKANEAHLYAASLPNNPICSKILADHEALKPITIIHEQAGNIRVNIVDSIIENQTKSIFNSKQERIFYFALRNCYPSYFIYPNIALSTIIGSAFVDQTLEASERKFFYNTTVDFVIVDQLNDFKPLVAIELDSEWHRLNNQGSKDAIKNKILKAAGLPLYRIEHLNKYKTQEEFQQVITDTVIITR
ncbi:hypothetical protein D3C87_298940 [compost metagenome]